MSFGYLVQRAIGRPQDDSITRSQFYSTKGHLFFSHSFIMDIKVLSLSLLYNGFKSVLLPPKIYITDVSLCFCLPKGMVLPEQQTQGVTGLWNSTFTCNIPKMNSISIYYFSENEENKYYILTICFTDYAKAFDYGLQQTADNSLRDENNRPPYFPSQKAVCRSRSSILNQTWKNRLVQNWKRSMSRLYTVTLLI